MMASLHQLTNPKFVAFVNLNLNIQSNLYSLFQAFRESTAVSEFFSRDLLSERLEQGKPVLNGHPREWLSDHLIQVDRLTPES